MTGLVRRLLPLCLLAITAGADEADPVVVQAGGASLRASELARRLAALPAFQTAALGRSPDEIRHAYLDTVAIPELLLSAEATRRSLAKDPRVRDRIREALRRSLVAKLRAETSARGITDAEVRAYYDAHADAYRTPERLRLARILVADADAARRILTEVRGPEAAKRWSELARDLSLDEATKMRGGALGFVHPDGHTDVPQVAVDPALFAAASRVKDGELVPEPVTEGARLAVVWRRGSLPKEERTLAEEAPRIRELLLRERADAAVRALLAELRAREVRAVDTTPLDTWKPEPGAAAGGPAASASGAAAAPPLGSTPSDPAPRETPRGLR